MDLQVALLSKGMRIDADGVVGIVTRVAADNPKDPKEIRVAVKPESGDEVWVKPEAIKKVLAGAPVAYAPPRERPVTNTTQRYRENPLLGLIEAMEDQRPGRRQGQFIEDMETRGQRELTNQTDKLPKEGSNDPAWAKMGVVFKEEVPGDPVFRFVDLPLGWTLKPTDHSMWNKLLDEQGRERAKMFYKAAFYDRSANIRPSTRFFVDREYKDEKDYDGPMRSVAKDGATGAVLFATEWLVKPEDRDTSYYEKQDALFKASEAWLNENRPQWRDASAYWGWD